MNVVFITKAVTPLFGTNMILKTGLMQMTKQSFNTANI